MVREWLVKKTKNKTVKSYVQNSVFSSWNTELFLLQIVQWRFPSKSKAMNKKRDDKYVKNIIRNVKHNKTHNKLSYWMISTGLIRIQHLLRTRSSHIHDQSIPSFCTFLLFFNHNLLWCNSFHALQIFFTFYSKPTSIFHLGFKGQTKTSYTIMRRIENAACFWGFLQNMDLKIVDWIYFHVHSVHLYKTLCNNNYKSSEAILCQFWTSRGRFFFYLSLKSISNSKWTLSVCQLQFLGFVTDPWVVGHFNVHHFLEFWMFVQGH